MTQPGEYEGPLAEFVALRTEIENRAQRQHNFSTLQVTAVAAIFSFALSQAKYTGIDPTTHNSSSEPATMTAPRSTSGGRLTAERVPPRDARAPGRTLRTKFGRDPAPRTRSSLIPTLTNHAPSTRTRQLATSPTSSDKRGRKRGSIPRSSRHGVSWATW